MSVWPKLSSGFSHKRELSSETTLLSIKFHGLIDHVLFLFLTKGCRFQGLSLSAFSTIPASHTSVGTLTSDLLGLAKLRGCLPEAINGVINIPVLGNNPII